LLLPSISFIKGASTAVTTDPGFLGWYFFLWGLFTMFMFIATLKKNTGLQVIFGTLFILFYLLALKEWGYISGNWIGYEGIICGFSAFYLAMAEVINETYGRTILPIGKAVVK
jgi:succinate-acetate transporter protein